MAVKNFYFLGCVTGKKKSVGDFIAGSRFIGYLHWLAGFT